MLVIGAIWRKAPPGPALPRQQQPSGKARQAGVFDGLPTFAGGIAHIFNNLLVGILCSAELAERRLPESSPALTDLRRIQEAAMRCAEVCEYLLAYAGTTSFVPTDIQLQNLVEEMTPSLALLAPAKTALKFRFVPDVPAIRGDPSQLRQMITELVTNAAEALGDEEGTIAVEVSLAKVAAGELNVAFTHTKLPGGNYVVLKVSDDGCGMDPDILERVFDPFFTTKFTRRGLGLASVLGIARKHGAALFVGSAPGKGTSFKLLFPAAAVRSGSLRWLASLWKGLSSPRLVHRA